MIYFNGSIRVQTSHQSFQNWLHDSFKRRLKNYKSWSFDLIKYKGFYLSRTCQQIIFRLCSFIRIIRHNKINLWKLHLFVIEKDLQISKQKRWIYSTRVVFVSTMEECLINIIYEVIFTIIVPLTFLPTFMNFRIKQQNQEVLNKNWRINSKCYISYSIFWVTSFFRNNEH